MVRSLGEVLSTARARSPNLLREAGAARWAEFLSRNDNQSWGLPRRSTVIGDRLDCFQGPFRPEDEESTWTRRATYWSTREQSMLSKGVTASLTRARRRQKYFERRTQVSLVSWGPHD